MGDVIPINEAIRLANNDEDTNLDEPGASRSLFIRLIRVIVQKRTVVIIRQRPPPKNKWWFKIARFFDYTSVVALPLLWIYSFCLYNTVLYHNFGGYYDPFSGAKLTRDAALILANKHLIGVRITLLAHALGIIANRFGYGVNGNRRAWWSGRAVLSCVLMNPLWAYKLAWFGIIAIVGLIITYKD